MQPGCFHRRRSTCDAIAGHGGLPTGRAVALSWTDQNDDGENPDLAEKLRKGCRLDCHEVASDRIIFQLKQCPLRQVQLHP